MARNDQNNDGKLSTAELQGIKLGRRMSVDKFARLDRDDDGMLEASELSRKKARRIDVPSLMEQVVAARFADYLAANSEPQVKPDASKVAEAVIARLDGDGSAGLNSEEIAGTRLAERLGSGFYELDGDKNGALDKHELTSFISKAYLGEAEAHSQAVPVVANEDSKLEDVKPTASDVVNPDVFWVSTEATEPVDPTIQTEPVEAAEAQSSSVAVSEPSSSVAYVDQIRASFEAALEVLKSGADQRSAYDVVRTLYAEVSGIIG
ncbi:MAG: hypothetical protein QNJ09_00675 [Paracoccaceae bacterium]|nr:hypothetical protein [Paracoccaceae bacterium]